MKGNIPYWFYYALAAVLSPVVASLAAWAFLPVFWAVSLCISAALGFSLYMTQRKHVLFRKSPGYNSLEMPCYMGLSLCFVLAAGLSGWDIGHGRVAIMPPMGFYIGVALLVCGYLILVQSMMGSAVHFKEKYGQPEQKSTGPYALLRYPVMLGILLMLGAFPLWIGSGLGFIAMLPAVVLVLIYTGREDDCRFTRWSWYQDYIKQVQYRIIPYIW